MPGQPLNRSGWIVLTDDEKQRMIANPEKADEISAEAVARLQATNPFMSAEALADEPPEANPFLDIAPAAASKALVPGMPACGDSSCKSAHRPDGSHYSPDRSVRMREMMADGKMGPEFGKLGGQKPKKNKTALKVIAEGAAENAGRIQQVFLDGIDESNPIGIRLAAAKQWVEFESKDTELELKRAKDEHDNMSKDELVGSIMTMLNGFSQASTIAGEVEEMIEDADVVNEDA